MSKRWYYSTFGEKHGPVSDGELRELADRKELLPDDLVWMIGLAEWKPARHVNGLFKLESVEPPPLPTNPTSSAGPRLQDGLVKLRKHLKSGWAGADRCAWMLVAVPVVCAVMQLLVGRVMPALFFILNWMFGIADEKRLKSEGQRAPSMWLAVLLVPLYLLERSRLLRRPRIHFGMWIVSFVIALALSQCSENRILESENRKLEEAARQQVTQIMRAKCVRVRITEEVGDGYYRAIATFENGHDLPVWIESRESSVRVKIQ